jgi:DNA (cytosine-5)-methyltransferase 1
MRLGSLCSGYGGLEAGIGQVLDIEPVWCSEIDKDASKVLATHHPDVPNLGDLTALDWHQVQPVDIMCAGFPCQPFSYAGERQGADDERAIFSYIAEAISVLRPRLVVLENVPGILTLGGTGVIAAVAGLGYDCRWGIVRARDTGAPHKRARWFCLAYDPADASGAERRTPQHETVDKATRRAAEPGERASATAWGCYTRAIRRWERILGRRAPDPTDDRGLRPEFVEWMMGLDEGYICDLGLSRTAALKMLGNGVVPQQAALAVDLLL